MIKFTDLVSEQPYIEFVKKYNKAIKSNQKNIEAISIASFDKEKNEVDSRYVNLKLINKEDFIFFTNYDSPKSTAFKSHNQISALIYWPVINTQIRMKAKIKKTTKEFNKNYFKKRDINKNALAISSEQSKIIESYSSVIKRFENTIKKDDLHNCPDYWGGFSFTPFYFEFWEGKDSRLNKRNVYKKIDKSWKEYFLQP